MAPEPTSETSSGPYTTAQQPNDYYRQPMVPVQIAPSNGLGVAGFVLGLLGLLLFWVPVLGAILAILGVILGGVGISQGRKSGAGTGLAVAGLVCGILGLLPALFIVIAASS
jgi:hypothetical protein